MGADLADLRRRAAQQASHGNYWAGKCVALIDRFTTPEGASFPCSCPTSGWSSLCLRHPQFASPSRPGTPTGSAGATSRPTPYTTEAAAAAAVDVPRRCAEMSVLDLSAAGSPTHSGEDA
jgi:hypothetical protein